MNINWLLKMAWRDSRRNRGRLLLFISSIIIGIAALVAINSFSENLQKDINNEAKTLLGADIQVEGNQPYSPALQVLFDSIGGERSDVVNFASMAFFPRTEGTRLVQIKAVEGAFPFYGKLNTKPKSAMYDYKNGQTALVDRTVMIQFGVEVGDKVRLGQLDFEIAGEISAAPGRAGVASSVAPVVYIPKKYLDQTQLIQPGSIVEYAYYFKLEEGRNPDVIMDRLRPRVKEFSLNYDTVEDRKRGLSIAFGGLAKFLNLVGFVALLLGCIGVASSVHIYVKDKLSTVAILRCLGVSGRQSLFIYLTQIFAIGLIGAIVGAALGSFLQYLLPIVLGEFLPLENVSNDISLRAMGLGIITGLGIAILFALLPLLAIRKTSPLRTLRASFEDDTSGSDPIRWLIYGLIVLFIGGFTYLQTEDILTSVLMLVGIGVAFLLLIGVASLLIFIVKKFFPTRWSYVWRQGIANLFRPNNQTLILMVSIGLGTALISTLFFTQDILLNQVAMTGSDNQPNIIIFDIQSSQKEAVSKMVTENDMPLIQEVPIVTMRVDNINGVTKKQYLQDTTSTVRRWAYNREYRVTYRDTMIETETILDGKWHNEMPDNDTIYISIAERVADAMNAKIGTKIAFNVQGTLIETVVSSIREIDFGRVQTNFFVVFPSGILEMAPQFHVVVSRVETEQQSGAFQQSLVKAFPNVSAIDLTQILKSVDDILTKVSFVIRFMALFSILTGLLVLISSIVLSKYQRIQESVLLRTLGARASQIRWINVMEYFLLGTLATLTGILLSVVGSWLLAKYSFKIPFVPNWWSPFWLFFIVTTLTILIGMLNNREVITKPPLEVLRKEV